VSGVGLDGNAGDAGSTTRRLGVRAEGGGEHTHKGKGVDVLGASATLISIIGDSFWTEGSSQEARVGVTGCELSAWVSETSLLCKQQWARARVQG